MIRSEKLRNKLIESTHQPPHENRLLMDLPDERWEPFPVAPYDEHYAISNKGRVKRLAHIRTNIRGVSTLLPEKIIKQCVNYNINRSLNEKVYYLMCHVGKARCRRGFITARLVYYTFVEPFDLKDSAWFVRHKDENGLNCLPDNLYLFEKRKLAQWITEHNRAKLPPPVSEIWKEGIDSGNYTRMIQPVGVAKYSFTGDLIDAFPSITAAAKHLGMSTTVVAKHISGNLLNNKKYILKKFDIYQNPPTKIEVELSPEAKIIDARKYGVPEGKIYPFQQISLDDLPGEQWKPIPDTDQVFWISDLGRVKSMDHIIHSSLHGNYLRTGRIIHQDVKRKGKTQPFLSVNFINHEKRVHYQMTRLVYNAFVGKIPKHHLVTHKDKDKFNCRAENLMLCSRSDMRKQYFINKAAANP